MTAAHNMLLDGLLTPLTYAFMQRSLVAAIIVGIVCAVVGTHVVVRGMAFLGDALSHAILPGVAVVYIIGGGIDGPLFFGGLVAGILAALGIGAITQDGRLKEDTAIGVVFAGAFALGIALISTRSSYSLDLSHILFGNVLGISGATLRLIAIFGSLVLVASLLLHKELTIVAFDPTHAQSVGLPTNFLRYVLLVLVAITTVVALNTVGIALMVAMLVTPAATAYQIAYRLPRVMLLAAVFSVFSAISGLYLSFYQEIAAGAAIVLVATALFIVTFLLHPQIRRLRG